jgi:hypothetical protein
VAEFASSGLKASEFCRRHGLALSTLRRRLAKRVGGGKGLAAGSRWVSVELSSSKSADQAGERCAVEVLLGQGRRIGARPAFDSGTLARVVRVLEGL